MCIRFLVHVCVRWLYQSFSRSAYSAPCLTLLVLSVDLDRRGCAHTPSFDRTNWGPSSWLRSIAIESDSDAAGSSKPVKSGVGDGQSERWRNRGSACRSTVGNSDRRKSDFYGRANRGNVGVSNPTIRLGSNHGLLSLAGRRFVVLAIRGYLAGSVLRANDGT